MGSDTAPGGDMGHWEPDSPALRGEDRADLPDGWAPTHQRLLDELTHTERVTRDLVNEHPDPGYDPENWRDQAPAVAVEPLL